MTTVFAELARASREAYSKISEERLALLRDAFESWAPRRWPLDRDDYDGENYAVAFVQEGWEAWQVTFRDSAAMGNQAVAWQYRSFLPDDADDANWENCTQEQYKRIRALADSGMAYQVRALGVIDVNAGRNAAVRSLVAATSAKE